MMCSIVVTHDPVQYRSNLPSRSRGGGRETWFIRQIEKKWTLIHTDEDIGALPSRLIFCVAPPKKKHSFLALLISFFASFESNSSMPISNNNGKEDNGQDQWEGGFRIEIEEHSKIKFLIIRYLCIYQRRLFFFTLSRVNPVNTEEPFSLWRTSGVLVTTGGK